MPITKKTKRKPPRADEIVRKEIPSGKRMVVQFPTSLYRETLAAVEELQVNQADLAKNTAREFTFVEAEMA